MNHARFETTIASSERPSFFIRILYRQHNSWQGEVQWLEAKRTRRFRSALELMVLIQEALDITGSPETSSRFRKWSETDHEKSRPHPVQSQ